MHPLLLESAFINLQPFKNISSGLGKPTFVSLAWFLWRLQMTDCWSFPLKLLYWQVSCSTYGVLSHSSFLCHSLLTIRLWNTRVPCTCINKSPPYYLPTREASLGITYPNGKKSWKYKCMRSSPRYHAPSCETTLLSYTCMNRQAEYHASPRLFWYRYFLCICIHKPDSCCFCSNDVQTYISVSKNLMFIPLCWGEYLSFSSK